MLIDRVRRVSDWYGYLLQAYDGPPPASAQSHGSPSISLESVLPPAYTERSDAATIEHSICSPPYSPRPLPRPPTYTVAPVTVLSPAQSPRTASPAAPYNDDIADPVLPTIIDDDRSFVPSDSDSESDSDLESDSEETLHDCALIQLAVRRPALHLYTHKVLDSTLSPVDPECLSKLDADLLLTPLDAWANVCYADSVSSESGDESEEEGLAAGADDRPRSRSSQHAYASSQRVRPSGLARHKPSASDISSVSHPARLSESSAPSSLAEGRNTPRSLKSPPPVQASRPPTPLSSPRSPPPFSSSRSPPPSSSRSPSPGMYRPALLAAPRPRRGILSLATIRSQTPPMSDSEGSDSDCGEPAPAPGRRTTTSTTTTTKPPPTIATATRKNLSGPPGWAAWLPVADVEERIAALHVDFGGTPDLQLPLAAADAHVEKGVLADVLTRPTSPVPGYPLLWSREPPNPADSVGGFPRREEVRAEVRRTRRGESLSRRVVGLFR